MDFLPSRSQMSQKVLVKCAHGLSVKLQNPNNLLRRHLANLIIFSILIGFPSSLNWMNCLVVLSLWGPSLIHLEWGAALGKPGGYRNVYHHYDLLVIFHGGRNENIAWIHPFSLFRCPRPLLTIPSGCWIALVPTAAVYASWEDGDPLLETVVSSQWMWNKI